MESLINKEHRLASFERHALQDEKITLIDFPQIVYNTHPNAEAQTAALPERCDMTPFGPRFAVVLQVQN